MALPLVFYVGLTPGFVGLLLGGGPALSRFMRQVVTNGVLVVFAVNYVAFFLYASATARDDPARSPVPVLALDVLARLATFFGLHILIYALSADWFGSFGGSRATALRVVAPTLARSAFFENISGVYLYATLVSAIPLYVSVLEGWLTQGRSVVHRRSRGIAVFLSLLLFGSVVVLLTGIAYFVSALQSSS